MVWNADRLQEGLVGYWDAPIFHPAKGTFAFSEPQPATMLVAPVFWMTASPALAYNVYLLLSLFLNGWFAVRLLRRLRLSLFASLIGGFAMVWHPLAHAQADVIQLIPLWPVLWLITAAIDLRSIASIQIGANNMRTRRVLLKGLELGIGCFMVFAVSIHHGLFVALLAPLTIWVFVPWRRIKVWWPGAMVSLALATILLIPLLLPMYRVMELNKFDRPESLVGELSAKWSDIFNVQSSALIRWSSQNADRPWYLSPGWFRTFFAILAISELRSIRRLRTRPLVKFLVLLAVASALLSMGTNLQVAGWKLWPLLSQYCPGMSQVRSAFRFGYFMQLSLILLCAVGFDRVQRWLMIRLRSRRLSGILGKVILAAVAVLLAIEIPPQALQTVGVPNLSRVDSWETFLRAQLTPGKCCIFLPFAPGRDVADFDQTTRWMLRTTHQHLPILNGYSGFFPQSHFDNETVFRDAPFSDDSLRRMTQSLVQFIVVQRHSELKPQPDSKSAFRVEKVFDDSFGTIVFEITFADPKARKP